MSNARATVEFLVAQIDLFQDISFVLRYSDDAGLGQWLVAFIGVLRILKSIAHTGDVSSLKAPAGRLADLVEALAKDLMLDILSQNRGVISQTIREMHDDDDQMAMLQYALFQFHLPATDEALQIALHCIAEDM